MKAILSIFVLVAATIVCMNINEGAARCCFIVCAFAIIFWIYHGNKCPKCKKAHALDEISRVPINYSQPYPKKDANGTRHSYHKVTENVTRRCKYCSYEFDKAETREEQLD